MDVIIQLVNGGDDLVSRVIREVTGGPAHTRIFFPTDPGLTCETTRWGFLRSGHRQTVGELPCDIRLRFKVPWTHDQIVEGVRISVEKTNTRAWYNFALTFFDLFLYPTRKFWAWRYRRTGKAPFYSPVMNCSADVDDIVKRAYGDLWPGEPESLTVPGDYLHCDALEVVG